MPKPPPQAPALLLTEHEWVYDVDGHMARCARCNRTAKTVRWKQALDAQPCNRSVLGQLRAEAALLPQGEAVRPQEPPPEPAELRRKVDYLLAAARRPGREDAHAGSPAPSRDAAGWPARAEAAPESSQEGGCGDV